MWDSRVARLLGFALCWFLFSGANQNSPDMASGVPELLTSNTAGTDAQADDLAWWSVIPWPTSGPGLGLQTSRHTETYRLK